ncbi:hypothetical protein BHE74_00054708 [Ensete ventricosum]|nr:hypothetical protein BHE74_00054708 [Ensete ventricosum]
MQESLWLCPHFLCGAAASTGSASDGPVRSGYLPPSLSFLFRPVFTSVLPSFSGPLVAALLAGAVAAKRLPSTELPLAHVVDEPSLLGASSCLDNISRASAASSSASEYEDDGSVEDIVSIRSEDL